MKQMKQEKYFALAMIAALFALTSCAHTSGEPGTITVSGTGQVSAVPDMAVINFSLSEIAPTTSAAQARTAAMTTQALAILKAQKVEDKDIQTQTLSFFPEYDWTDQGRRLLGQRARQTLLVTVTGIEDSTARLSLILDQLAEIDGIELQNVAFDLSDKDEMAAEARALAFAKAREKAQQYASLAGVSLGRVISIQESLGPAGFSPNEMVMRGAGASAPMPAGELDISVQINLVFQLP
jgi:hypothetical protein